MSYIFSTLLLCSEWPHKLHYSQWISPILSPTTSTWSNQVDEDQSTRMSQTGSSTYYDHNHPLLARPGRSQLPLLSSNPSSTPGNCTHVKVDYATTIIQAYPMMTTPSKTTASTVMTRDHPLNTNDSYGRVMKVLGEQEVQRLGELYEELFKINLYWLERPEHAIHKPSTARLWEST